MSKSLIIALFLIAMVVAVALHNSGSQGVNMIFTSIKTRESVVMLSFFIVGIVAGMFLGKH